MNNLYKLIFIIYVAKFLFHFVHHTTKNFCLHKLTEEIYKKYEDLYDDLVEAYLKDKNIILENFLKDLIFYLEELKKINEQKIVVELIKLEEIIISLTKNVALEALTEGIKNLAGEISQNSEKNIYLLKMFV